MGFAPFGFAPPCRGPNHAKQCTSFLTVWVRRADQPDRLFHRDAVRESPGLVDVARDVEHVIHGVPVTDVPDDSVHEPCVPLFAFLGARRALCDMCAPCLILLSPYGAAG